MSQFAVNKSKSRGCSSCCCLWTAIVVAIVILAVFFLVLTGLTYLSGTPYGGTTTAAQDEGFDLIADNATYERALRLANGIAIRSVAFAPSRYNETALVKLRDYIEKSFPLIHSATFVTRHVVNNFSLLYRVEGQDPSAGPPYLLCSHLDVVPAGDVSKWGKDPFDAGIVDNEYIFGRGTLDAKHLVFGMLEALEYKLGGSERPKRTIYIAFGHDEEVMGENGAMFLAEELEKQLLENNETLDFVLDEGTFIIGNFLPGISSPLAFVSVTEKGYLTVNVTAHGLQGHSSSPPSRTALVSLVRALGRLQSHPQPSHFNSPPLPDTFAYVAPHASFPYRLVYANLWLFRTFLSDRLTAMAGTSDAMQRTSTAATILRAGVKDNVVPATATATINLRVHPADTLEQVLAHINETIDDESVDVRVESYFAPPAKVSPYGPDAPAFRLIADSASQVYPGVSSVPVLLVASTDTKHYLHLTDRVYRFSPVLLDRDGLSRYHGIDERISLENYENVVQFYYRLMNNADRY